MRSRVEVRSLTAAQLASFRQAVTASKAISDDRGYAHWSGIHGWPGPVYCKHNSPLFLPWHRAYLYLFEKSLQDQVADVTLPWWDWTSATSHANGIPDAYIDTSADNPLLDAPVNITGDQITVLRKKYPGTISDDATPTTVRDPDTPDALPKTVRVESVLQAPRFDDFTTRLEDIHNRVHGWVGGSMSMIPVAAFDPVFWAHHAMIDRLWFLWQTRHPSVTPQAAILNTVLDPFPFTVAQVLDTSLLGYTYAVAAIS